MNKNNQKQEKQPLNPQRRQGMKDTKKKKHQMMNGKKKKKQIL